jgi:CDP-6-deoxy-D-xylo-4-hexulose-3-dehydrase
MVEGGDGTVESLVVPYAGRVYDEAELANAHKAVDEFWLTEGRWCARFENGLKNYLGVGYCRLTNSGSSANLLAIAAAGIRARDEVITSAVGFPTTIAPIVQCGAIPVFVDADPITADIDVSQLEAALSDGTVAVMTAHTLGNPFDVYAVAKFCADHNLILIEDNCDALGSRYDGQLTGTLGHIATSSFYPAHHITTGEGGAVYTDDERTDTLIASYRDWGRDCYCRSGKENTCGKRFAWQLGQLPVGYDHKYTYSHFGYSLRMTDVQAAVGLAQLDKLKAFGVARRKNWAWLRNALGHFGNVFEFQDATYLADPSWFGFLITVREDAPFTRNQIVAHLEAAKIQTRPLFAGNVTRQPCFDELTEGIDYRVIGSLDVADRFMERAFWVGVYPGLTRQHLEYMFERIAQFVEAR